MPWAATIVGGLTKALPGGEILEVEKIVVDKFGSPPSHQTFPSIVRMLCAKMCAQEITVTIQSPPGNSISHPEPTGKQQQGTLYQILSSLLRRSFKSAPCDLGPLKKTPQTTPLPRYFLSDHFCSEFVGVRHTCVCSTRWTSS